MDRHFKRVPYCISLVTTLFFFSIVVASYVDNHVCPIIMHLALESSKAGTQSTLVARFIESPISIFDSDFSYFPCNVVDLLVHIYAVGFAIFMLHKWITYRRAGWHYFMLDYCYFHNLFFIIFLCFVSVKVQENTVKQLQLPTQQATANLESISIASVMTRVIASAAHHVRSGDIIINIGNTLRATVPSFLFWTCSSMGFQENGAIAAKWIDSFFAPWSSKTTALQFAGPSEFRAAFIVIVQPVRRSVYGLSGSELESLCALFIMFLSGAFGPILGAIMMWKNALLFHSFDKMTACYLHLAPPLVQTVLLSSVFTVAEVIDTLQAHFPAGGQLLRQSGLKPVFLAMFSFQNLIVGHIFFFLLWQLFYHTTFELFRARRIRKAKKTIGTERLRLLSTCGTNPTDRVTAYTYMMEQPPLGKKGIFFRTATLFGSGPLPTKIMFNVLQLILHIIFISVAYVFLHTSFVILNSTVLALTYLAFFGVFSIWNSSVVLYNWIKKLQKSS